MSNSMMHSKFLHLQNFSEPNLVNHAFFPKLLLEEGLLLSIGIVRAFLLKHQGVLLINPERLIFICGAKKNQKHLEVEAAI